MSEMLTVKDLQHRLHLSKNGAYELCRRSGFPVCRVGRKILVPVDRLDIWIANGGTANSRREAAG